QNWYQGDPCSSNEVTDEADSTMARPMRFNATMTDSRITKLVDRRPAGLRPDRPAGLRPDRPAGLRPDLSARRRRPLGPGSSGNGSVTSMYASNDVTGPRRSCPRARRLVEPSATGRLVERPRDRLVARAAERPVDRPVVRVVPLMSVVPPKQSLRRPGCSWP